METIHAVYENGVFRPLEAVSLPEKCEVELSVSRKAADPDDRPLMRLLEIARQHPDEPTTPVDYAAQHDHYLYGMPKRP
jgi:predicted DNA-binding antitoxin AbrB/MazE fold protein